VKHTSEPWVVYNAGDEGDTYIGDKEGHVSPIAENFAEADAFRVVTCVNAMAGIEDPAAFVKAVREIIDGASPSHTDGEDGKPIYRRLREQSN